MEKTSPRSHQQPIAPQHANNDLGYLDELDKWTMAGPPNEGRSTVCDEIKRCLSDTSTTSYNLQNSDITELPPIPPQLTSLFVYNCNYLKQLGDENTEIHLVGIHISHCAIFEKVPEFLNSLTSFRVEGCPQYKQLSSCMPSLTTLHINNCENFSEISESIFENSTELIDIHIENCLKLKIVNTNIKVDLSIDERIASTKLQLETEEALDDHDIESTRKLKISEGLRWKIQREQQLTKLLISVFSDPNERELLKECFTAPVFWSTYHNASGIAKVQDELLAEITANSTIKQACLHIVTTYRKELHVVAVDVFKQVREQAAILKNTKDDTEQKVLEHVTNPKKEVVTKSDQAKRRHRDDADIGQEDCTLCVII